MRIPPLILLLVILGTLHSPSLHSQDSLSVLSWNIQMLPGIIRNNGKMKRARAIVDQLRSSDYDIVVFQEIFHRHTRKWITHELNRSFPYHTHVLNQRSISLKTNGGVMLFSKHPILDVHEIRFRSRKGFDRMARKGALLADIEVRGKTLQVVGTHLQAFGTDKILYDQYDKLANELLARFQKDSVPQLICGDFNTLKSVPNQLPDNVSQQMIQRLPRYDKMLETLKAHDGELSGEQQFTMDRPYNDLCKKRKDFRLLLDYVLLRPNGLKDYQVHRKVRIMRFPWHPEHQDLSDHFGLEARLSGF